MQEDLEQRTVSVSIQAAKLSGRVLRAAIAAVLQKMEQERTMPRVGRNSMKRLTYKDPGANTIEVSGRIRSFERYARKHQVRYHMTSEIKDILENMTTAAPEMEDYIGEDGLLYCGKCHTPKEAYFPEGKELFGRDRHPAECDCQRAAREQRQAAEEHRRHVEAVENLKQRAFADSAMQQWTFENDNGRNPQTGIARRYAEHWEEMQAENIGCLFWGNVGNGKSYLAGCIANALMEKEVPVYMTNFAVILGDLSPGFTGRNEYISRLCRYPLLIIDDFGMERGTDYGLEQVFHVIDTRYRSNKPLIATTNRPLDELKKPTDTAHSRIYDRLLSMCVPIRFTGVNFRQETAKRKMETMKKLLAE